MVLGLEDAGFEQDTIMLHVKNKLIHTDFAWLASFSIVT